MKISVYCLSILEQNYLPLAKEEAIFPDKKLIAFSVLDLKNEVEKITGIIEPIRFYEFILLFFHHLKILELKDGLMVFYNPMKITRKIDNNRKKYTQEDYEQLEQYYKSKTEQILSLIHI